MMGMALNEEVCDRLEGSLHTRHCLRLRCALCFMYRFYGGARAPPQDLRSVPPQDSIAKVNAWLASSAQHKQLVHEPWFDFGWQ